MQGTMEEFCHSNQALQDKVLIIQGQHRDENPHEEDEVMDHHPCSDEI